MSVIVDNRRIEDIEDEIKKKEQKILADGKDYSKNNKPKGWNYFYNLLNYLKTRFIKKLFSETIIKIDYSL